MLNLKFLVMLAIVMVCHLTNTTPAKSQKSKDIYKNIGTLKGQIHFINHPELGKTPANFMYVVFQRVDCKKCLIGTKTDIDGNYEVFLGLGRYKVIIYHPSPPTYDMIAPNQPRFVKVISGGKDTLFDINLKLQFNN